MSLFAKPKGKHDKETLAYQRGYEDAKKEMNKTISILSNRLAITGAEKRHWEREYETIVKKYQNMLKWEAEDDNT